MSVPLSQVWTVSSYVLRQKLRGRRRFPLVLMLEPLFRCNLACAGCGKIQHPADVLRRELTPEECFDAAEECGAPIVSLPGGEPLLHPQIDRIVDGLVRRRRYVYLCTNALLLEESLPRFRASRFLTFSVHLDGPREEHDSAVCREGVFDKAVAAIRAAVDAGFRVTTNTTLYSPADVDRYREFFDDVMDLGVEGMMISPGYPYPKAPDQDHFLAHEDSVPLFRRLFDAPSRRWKFNQSPLFLEFLRGGWSLECTPWGNPTYNVFGWQRPCYLLDEGYEASFDELMQRTSWDDYGPSSGNPSCRDCRVHSGFEPTAVFETFGSLRGMLATARRMLFGLPRLPDTPTDPPAADRPATTTPSIPLPVLPARLANTAVRTHAAPKA